MNKIISIVVALLIVAGGAYYYFQPKAPAIDQIATVVSTGTVATTGTTTDTTTPSRDAITYAIAPDQMVGWIGRKVGGEHTGTVAVTEGGMTVSQGEPATANFTVAMNTIVVSDITDSGMNAQLLGHLKSADFFDVTTYPTVVGQIQKFEKTGAGYLVTATLTMKGVSHTIQFPAKIAVGDGAVTVVANFFIDGTLWNMNGKPGVTDKFIGIGLNLRFVAQK